MVAYDIDLTRMSYAEGIDTIFGNGVTIGYCIHFPRGFILIGQIQTRIMCAGCCMNLSMLFNTKEKGSE